MAEYIAREAFLEHERERYCKDCARRTGLRNGKYKTLYEIGEAPCRACEISDVLNDIEDFPAADVRPVVLCKDCNYYNTAGCSDGYGWCEDSVVSTGVSDNFFCARADMREES